MKTMYMNPPTGSVDTMENWKADFIENPDLWNSEDDLETLIEVEWDENEQTWVEVE